MGGDLLRRKILMSFIKLRYLFSLLIFTIALACPGQPPSLGAEIAETGGQVTESEEQAAGTGTAPGTAAAAGTAPATTAAGAPPIQAEPPKPPEPSRPLRGAQTAKPDRFLIQKQNEAYWENRNSLTIPGLEKPLTQQFVRQYSSSGGLAWLKTTMERGAPYLGFIRREVEERGLPPELVYLPVIESTYLATAMSRSGAAGLWQFMKNSIGPFDMKVTDWADERMDFWKATFGALKKLEENYNHFQDWPLALAAYNAGLGGVNRIVNQTGIRDYWVLSEKKQFKNETIQYVPKLLAVSYILTHQREFGLSPAWPEDPQWVRLPLSLPVDLELLAELAGIDGELLKMGNRELRYPITPPSGAYQLKVPAFAAAAVSTVLEQKERQLIKYHYHIIGYGDTLSALAQHYRVPVDQILASNPGTEARFLQIGKRLRIPAVAQVGSYPSASAAAPPQQQPKTAGEPVPGGFQGTHLVKRGETLWSIALAYHVDPLVLAEANEMGLNDILREGRVLKTPIIE
jgi:membrane-bound lytic murein transglycosylase D